MISVLSTMDYKVPLLCVFACFLHGTWCIENDSTNTTVLPSTESTITTTTLSPELVCKTHNDSCGSCVGAGVSCVYCHKSKICIYYPHEFPPKGIDCDLSDASWSTCIMNLKTIIISVSVVCGILILAIIVCCCCCCRKNNRNKWAKELEKWERERKERKLKQDERRQERQLKTDEIRKKYGLFKEDNPYSRFDG